jgi:antitoxin ParD1/3/4
MPTVTVEMPPHLKEFFDSEVATRNYASAGEYLTLLVQKAHIERNRRRVEQLLVEGLESGPATPMTARDWDEFDMKLLSGLRRTRGNENRKGHDSAGSFCLLVFFIA